MPQSLGEGEGWVAHWACRSKPRSPSLLFTRTENSQTHTHKFHVGKKKKKKTHQTHRICSHFLWELGGQRCPDSTGSEGSCWPLQCPPGPTQTGPWEWKTAYPGCVSASSGSGSTEGSWGLSRSFLPRPPLDKRENTSITLFAPTENCRGPGIISMTTSGFVLKVESSKRLSYQFIFSAVRLLPASSQHHHPSRSMKKPQAEKRKRVGWITPRTDYAMFRSPASSRTRKPSWKNLMYIYIF